MRSKKVEGRVPFPLHDAIQLQMKEGIIKQGADSRIVTGSYLVQSFWGVSHPFSDRYFQLSLERRDLIDDFSLALNEAGLIRRKKFLSWLEKDALTNAETFTQAGRRMLDRVEELAEIYHETRQLPVIE